MDAVCLRTGDRATVQFEFISHPEFIKEGMKLLFREGKTKARFISICLTFSDTANVGSWGYNPPHPSTLIFLEARLRLYHFFVSLVIYLAHLFCCTL
jgi:hypothetical protein